MAVLPILPPSLPLLSARSHHSGGAGEAATPPLLIVLFFVTSPSSGWDCEAPARSFFVVPRNGGAKRQAQTYGDAVDDWRGNGACVVFTPVMDQHQRKDGHRPAASVCHAVSINVVKHDGANAKTCDSMQNEMERHGMAGEEGVPYSVSNLKTMVHRQYLLKRFICVSGIKPDSELIKQLN